MVNRLIEVNAPEDATHYRQHNGSTEIFWIKSIEYPSGLRWYTYNDQKSQWDCLLLSRYELPQGLKALDT